MGVEHATLPPRGGGGPTGTLSLEGLHSTVPVPPPSAGFWRQCRAFTGPAYQRLQAVN